MIDFHTHTFFSDGVLVPSELVRRAGVIGYEAIGLADHVDSSNLESVLDSLVRVARELNSYQKVYVIPGVEITHAPKDQIGELVLKARNLGAKLVIVHGESPVEPVEVGTNRAAISAGPDILAHPGLITDDDVLLAAQRGVFLEITSRSGHSLTNGHVAKKAIQLGARLVISTDTHAPENLITDVMANTVLQGAGLTHEQAMEVFENNRTLLEKMRAKSES